MSDGILKVSLRVLSPGAFLLLLVLALLTSPALAAESEREVRLRRTVETLSAPASRMTGYPGAAAAREWLVAELERLGISEFYRHEFPVLVPMDEGFWLECADERLELFGVWPNLVRTPTLPAEGIEGQLVYGGDGSRLEGQPVAGRIVLLDYVSGTAWVDAFHLGAAAVVFWNRSGRIARKPSKSFSMCRLTCRVSMRAKTWRNVCGCWQGRGRRCACGGGWRGGR